jgi:diamine N-acetyltransferase
MNTLQGKHIKLRALEPSDLEFLFNIENDEQLWGVSQTQTPYSRYNLQKYLEQSHRDIHDIKQLRLVISSLNDDPMGFIDLFDFDILHRRAGVGIVLESSAQNQGYGKTALQLLIQYSFNHLNLHQLYCNILDDNTISLALFESCGFRSCGLKKEWFYQNGNFKNEHIYQLLNHEI